ncbi:large ribosomal subunit protein bL32m-like [Diadema antillarum]|uniref:large ribosomal subunit protein bL32m-like n=1 Tax=Diadema antillarum TaxID=105358 RepID=UPI003A88C0CC
MATNMLRNVSSTLRVIFNRFNATVGDIIEKNMIRLEPAIAVPGMRCLEPESSCRQGDEGDARTGSSLRELFDGFLWAVPKHRRSIQRNRTRRRAVEKRVQYNESLVPCEVCGNLRQVGYVCGHCLVQIREETKQIQDTMFEELNNEGIIPDRENLVLYEGETPGELDANKRPVEIKRKRPLWFSRDLVDDGTRW